MPSNSVIRVRITFPPGGLALENRTLMVRNYLCSKVSSLKPDIGQFTLSAEVVQKLCAADNGFGLCYPTDLL